MRASSAVAAVLATQSSVAARNQKLRVAVSDRVEQTRALLVQKLPHGTKRVIAEIIGCRKERISRELQGVEKLSEEVLSVAIEILRIEGESEVAERLCALRDGERSWVITRHTDGSVEWRFA